jgi:hypothetical protein
VVEDPYENHQLVVVVRLVVATLDDFPNSNFVFVVVLVVVAEIAVDNLVYPYE